MAEQLCQKITGKSVNVGRKIMKKRFHTERQDQQHWNDSRKVETIAKTGWKPKIKQYLERKNNRFL